MNSQLANKNNPIRLLTGIPRSGTTLCCRLLNSADDVIALHEPLDPLQIESCDIANVVDSVNKAIANIRSRIINGEPFSHGDRAGLVLDNPVEAPKQTSIENAQGVDVREIRKVKAERGQLTLEAQTLPFTLVVKQNAMFAALASALSAHYQLVAIVRNPISVLASWMMVDLPVNRGRVPGGERFDPALARDLEGEPSILKRQLSIYRWFCRKYVEARLPIIRYEKIISSNGADLFREFGINQYPNPEVEALPRNLPNAVVENLHEVAANWQPEDASNLYTKSDVETALLALNK